VAKLPFFSTYDYKATEKRLAAVLDQLAYEPIRPDLPGFESYTYGQGYIWELARNLRVLFVDASRKTAEDVFGPSAKKRPGETIEAHDRRLEALVASRPGSVPIPMSTLEISTALRFGSSPRKLDPNNKEPIRGLTVGKMLALIQICALNANAPDDPATVNLRNRVVEELMAAKKLPQFREQLVAEQARIAVRTAAKLNLMDIMSSVGDGK